MPHFAPTASNWVYLGLGIALSYGFSLARRLLGPLAQARQAHVLGKAASVGGPGSALLPSEIMAAIQNSPVMQQSQATIAYHGMNVRWRVSFESAFPSGLTTLRLMCQDRGDYPWVLCDIRRGKYPQLAGMPPHTQFWMSGRIAGIKGDQIFLRGVSLSFDE